MNSLVSNAPFSLSSMPLFCSSRRFFFIQSRLRLLRFTCIPFFFFNTSASINTDDKAFFVFLILLTLVFYYSRLTNTDDGIARRLDDRLRNSSFPNIGTTCMKDAPPASTKDSYVCGPGEKTFNFPTDSQDYNRNARCSECFSKALQICPADSFGRPPTRKTKSGIVVR